MAAPPRTNTEEDMPRLETGAQAPQFAADTWRGEPISSADLAGRRVWLAFFRYASCPLCNLRVNDLVRRHQSFIDAGIEVLAVFQSDSESITKHVGQQAPPFKLITDPDQRLYRLFGVERSTAGFLNPTNLVGLAKAMGKGFAPGMPDGPLNTIPADFLLEADGTLADVYYGSNIGDHIPFERVDAFMAS